MPYVSKYAYDTLGPEKVSRRVYKSGKNKGKYYYVDISHQRVRKPRVKRAAGVPYVRPIKACKPGKERIGKMTKKSGPKCILSPAERIARRIAAAQKKANARIVRAAVRRR